jgi:hypothetical protein
MNLSTSLFRISRFISFSASYSFLPRSVPRAFSHTASCRSIEMGTVDTSGRLAKLRELMQQHNVDVYSKLNFHILLPPPSLKTYAYCMRPCASEHLLTILGYPQLYLRKTVISRNISHPVTHGEVSQRGLKHLYHFVLLIQFSSSLYLRVHGLRGHCCHFNFQSRTLNGWSLLQPSGQAIGR